MKKSIYMLACLTVAAACEALDQAPSTSVTTDTAITGVEDLANAVNGAYYVATYGTMLTVASEMSIYADLVGPDSYQPASSGQNASRLAGFSMTANDTYNAYYYLYAAIASVNSALEKAALLEDQEAVAPYVAELYAMRGLFHFHLATYFAPIPTSGSENQFGLVLADKVFDIDYVGKRASLADTYAFIIGDFTKAVETGLNKDRNTGHLNYWAALALRARANLYAGNYAAALDDAEEVLERSPYRLYTIDNYTKVWSQEGADEVIMEYLQTDTYNAQRYAPGYYASPRGYSEYGVSPEFYSWITSDPSDVRSQMVADYSVAPGGDPDYNEGYYPLKFPGNAGASVPAYVNNIKVLRLSEMLLVAAEAALKTGGDADSYVNALRRNRIVGYEDVATVTLEDILNERRKEFFAEGQIAFDFWRNGLEVANGSLVTGPQDYRTVLPFPKEEIDLAKGLLMQNPGY
ncbi:MAG: RagB/SusD family nutrient uptake outer membrane protein [Bacteroidales bacterium]|nr:RagB/SusD family nutrient uptake outer membrane protein [Bacteroidales bacterium]